ncbi:AAA family ATPase [Kineosporia babensis]|uniref:Nuclease SbcCD subunit C n=1 Tax=Kineosporia babensis TaxID=499548 RepID=A0A9X1NB08_9ACTN|nr:SMC family ATPase [Kineosporia babensis]MCD5310410.1 SMC family ATPase [Kineosporia babensis]
MRPVLLEMEGFASFRERAVVDFEEADYFAIVGPTGAGKSTLVDAMTFALFGSAPRWQRRNAVNMALSPHGNRAVVRLVFELAGERYVVAREVRRTGASVSAKNQRLERLPSATSRGEPDEVTESLATDSKVTGAVEALLGLSFEQFRQCVVLPQNAFAEFLHSTPSNRQEILLRLIGAEHYEQIQKRANEKASQSLDRVDRLNRTLAELGDATPEAEASAQEREQRLEELVAQVRAALPGLASAQEALAEALRDEEQLAGERDRLAAIVVPAGVAEIDQEVSAARAAATTAAELEAAAEQKDSAAREKLSAAPARGPLEQAVQHHTELAQLTSERPAAVASADAARRRHEKADHQVTAAELQHVQAQAAAERSGRAAEEAQRRVTELEGQHALLTRPSLPTGLDELDRDLTAARAEYQVLRTALGAAEKADEAAAAAHQAAPKRSKLERARSILEELAGLSDQLSALESRSQAAHQAAKDAAQAVQAGDAALRQARQRRDEVQRQHAARSLRAHLVAGEDCPVCMQPVSAVSVIDPAADTAHQDLAVVDAAIAKAETELDRSRALLDQASRAESGAEANLESARRRLAELKAQLPPECPDLTTADRLLAEIDALEKAAQSSSAQVRKARAEIDAVRSRGEQLAAAEARIRSALGQARDPLVGLGAPTVEDLTLPDAWKRLIGWAAEQAGRLSTELAEKRKELEAALAEQRLTGTSLKAGEDTLRQARTEQQQALAAAERARTTLEQAEQRIAQLGSELETAPALEEARAQLDQIAQLEAAVRQTDEALRVARQARDRARRQLTSLDDQLAGGWAVLRRARDSVVQLGAPEFEGESLLTGWNTLTTWSSSAAGQRSQALVAAQNVTAQRREQSATARAELTGVLKHHEIPVSGDDLATSALAAATGAHTEARGALERIRERRERAAQTVAERAVEERDAQVAKMLGELLRSTQFPRWLATAALESLVIEASDTLRQLSNNQFDLDHDDKGDLVVVDHTDADARRSVKTLSGGETFQASLAMALALSSQMSQLSSAGGARLDSIFLDEGFGTLDPDTLETVAGTLENLARGERMVGVITHVPALADRVPVRFNVRRDAQTSRVERQNL